MDDRVAWLLYLLVVVLWNGERHCPVVVVVVDLPFDVDGRAKAWVVGANTTKAIKIRPTIEYQLCLIIAREKGR